jgi:hypothetical protein
MPITFVKETDKRQTVIFEGNELPGKVFSITRCICTIQEQGTPTETQEVADMVLNALKNQKKQ